MTPSPPRSNAPVIVLVVCLVTAMIAAVGAGVAYSIRKQKERKEIETRVTPSSNANATDDLVDSDYRFTLRWPGKGFKILHEADAVRVAKNAKGALTHEGGCSLFVTAEYVPGAKLDSFADAITSSIALVDKKTLVREERTKWDRRGIELEVEGTTMGFTTTTKTSCSSDKGGSCEPYSLGPKRSRNARRSMTRSRFRTATSMAAGARP